MSDKPTILLDFPPLGILKPRLSEAYEVLTLWDQPDLDAFLDGPGQRVRVIMGGLGHLENRLIERLPNLGLIARVGTGYDAVDVPFARSRGVEVTNTPGVNADDVADMAMALLLAVQRGVLEGDRMVRSGAWTPTYRGPMRPSMKDRKVGVVGLGAIGVEVAARATAFRSEVRWWGPRPKPDAAWPLAESLLSLAHWCDVLMICARSDGSNARLIDGAVLDALGPAGVVVNITRGGILDEDALIARLKSGRLAGAGLDVFLAEPTPPDRWEGVPNTVLTPHIAGGGQAALRDMVELALENIRAYLAGEPPPTPVP